MPTIADESPESGGRDEEWWLSWQGLGDPLYFNMFPTVVTDGRLCRPGSSGVPVLLRLLGCRACQEMQSWPGQTCALWPGLVLAHGLVSIWLPGKVAHAGVVGQYYGWHKKLVTSE
ncbi:hypothetical protein NDU88_006252 [Pleurodeles waltl]|uniref:Uncharacterized protein n=1 Tax=Pleurodeles waltl TaxID=8319 RepID=A0AAV7MLS9_PLEWA|nr:hypothetical protein NDU88_006252 [Pleurodeles waltl]